MNQNTTESAKIWSPPVLEELTIDLTAIANSGKSTIADNKGSGKS